MLVSKTAEHLDWRDFINAADDTPKDVIDALDQYFRPFARPSDWTRDADGKIGSNDGHPCLKCGEALSPNLADFLLKDGGFEWGLVHGEGHCRKCGWPARLYHFIKNAKDEDLMTIRNILLQYHPNYVNAKP